MATTYLTLTNSVLRELNETELTSGTFSSSRGIQTAVKDFINKKTGELSSGQKNRVSLAKSLINKPEILLLDEPTASLDPDIGDYVRSYVQSYKSKNKVTILLASHNMAEVERLCDSVIMMKKGKIIDQGTSKEIINRHGRTNLEETFLKIVRSKDEVA